MKSLKSLASVVIGVVLLSHVAMGVTIEIVEIGNVGNADHSSGNGAVAYNYGIGKYEVTTDQYTEFLNAIAASDPKALWRATQSITRSGSDGSYTYATIGGFENRPVDAVQVRDAMRFVNWLHNGQPTGAQDTSTTEDGAYFLNGGDPSQSTVRESDWTYALPNVDEWYKAAYYDSGTTSYYNYPTSSDTEPGHLEDGSPNNACFVSPPLYTDESDMQDVGTYTASASPYGTFDQAGNAYELTEAWVNADNITKLGGPFNDTSAAFHADTAANGTLNFWLALNGYGIRVVTSVLPPQQGTLITIE